jgi:ABC-type amino acid transport substrate-binding protein
MRYFYLLFSSVIILLGGSNCSGPSPNKVYRIAIDQSWYPLDLMGKGPAIFAFSDDLLMTIARNEGFLAQLYPVSWDSLLSSVNQGKAEGAFSSILPVMHYKDEYSFSDSYLCVGPVLVVRANSTVESLSEMSGKEIGVISGTPAILLAEKTPSIIIRYFDKFPPALEELVNSKIDGVVMPSLLANSYVRDIYSGSLKVVNKPLTEEGLRLITLKDENEELIDAFNDGLKKLKEDGTYEKLLKKWTLK